MSEVQDSSRKGVVFDVEGTGGLEQFGPPVATDELWTKAQGLHLQDKLVEAEEIYCTLLEQNHDNKGLLATLGTLYLQAGRTGLAIHFLEDAIRNGFKEDPDVFTNLGIAYKNAGQHQKARTSFEKSIAENPTAEALTNYSAMFIECGESKKCAKLCEQAIALKNDLPIAHWNLSISLLGDGIWDKGWDEYDWGMKAQNVREDRKVLDVPLWDGTPSKTVLLYGEQGLGDEIMFSSMIPDLLKTNSVVLECHKRLENLFKKTFDFPIYGTREDKQVNWSQNHQIDYRLPIGSLGKFYRRKREDFPGKPFLKADSLEKNGKFRIGISWQGGGQKVGRVMKRSIPLTWWKPILNYRNVEFVSLQYTQSKEGLDILKALGYDIKRMDEYAQAQDYYETAKLVASCDLIITVCTSVVHLAGALGVPCWVMTPQYPAWRYQNSGGMPWYKSVRLYRSPSSEKEGWMPVIDKIATHLGELLNMEKARKYA